MKPYKLIAGLGVGMAAMMLAGCNLEEDNNDSESGSGTATGRMSLRVTDAPTDSAEKVVVVFTGVTLQAEDGERTEFQFEESKEIDLLALQGENSAPLLEEVTLEAGEYEWIRLHVAAEENVSDSYIEIDGAQHDLSVPSGSQTGLKLVNGFTVPENDTADFTLDFDLRKGVVHNANGYLLKPVVRMVDNTTDGEIEGTVDSAVITAECAAAVYVYAGADVTPSDLGGEGAEPLITKFIDTRATGVTEYNFELAFLATGEYTLAFTCEANRDEIDTEDALNWLGVHTVTVTADETTTVDFGI